MKYHSTQKLAPGLSFSEAMETGLASDGGLYLPEHLPKFSRDGLSTSLDILEVARAFLAPYFEGDALAPHLPSILKASLSFPFPVRPLYDDLSLLELFHGPTAAFKDVGARFLAHCFAQLEGRFTILVATSGDTGGAVASAFYQNPRVDVVILYPKGMVSPLQEQQLCCWGDNVRALRVAGTFDHCQALVKEAFNEEGLRQAYNLTSANSINLGRILPQTLYYAHAALREEALGKGPINLFIPTGNMGNALAAIWAKLVGLPIDHIVMATNQNQTIPDFFHTRTYTPRPSVKTLANAMDVGAPSNMERFLALSEDRGDLLEKLSASSVSDQEITETIEQTFQEEGEVVCPHTATALALAKASTLPRKVVVSTAHPSKFLDVVGPLTQNSCPFPDSLKDILNRPTAVTDVGPDLEHLKLALKGHSPPEET